MHIKVTIYSSLTSDHSFDDDFVRKLPVIKKKIKFIYWFRKIKKGMNMCTGLHDTAEIM